MPRPPVLRRAALLAVLCGGSACQTYDFQPVAPLSVRQTATSANIEAIPNKPNFMLLVDKSGSMDQPIDSSLAACHVGGINGPVCGDPSKTNPCDTSVCPTRWSELSTAIGQFLQNEPLIGRYGMGLFPEPEAGSGCSAMSKPRSDIPPASAGDADPTLQAAADAARTLLASVSSSNPPGPTGTGGGTPTALSLLVLENYAQLLDTTREDIVILLTDGLPNCDGNLASLSGTDACQCTFGPSPSDCPPNTPPFSGAGCLDADATVNVVQRLGSFNIQTFVVGFGADTGTDAARTTLQRMAVAGALKHPRVCPGTPPNQPCASDNPCDLSTGLCTKQYYQATDSASLAAVLKSITDLPQNICNRPLTEVPDDVALLSVTLDGTPYLQSATTWTYVPPSGSTPPAVLFVGPLCDRIKSSTAQNPAVVDIRILKIL